MSTTTPSIGRQVLATVKRYTVITGVLAGLALGYQAGEGDVPNGCDRSAGPCTAGEITGVDYDGELMIARDLNGDGRISGDVEYGS